MIHHWSLMQYDREKVGVEVDPIMHEQNLALMLLTWMLQ